MLYLLFSFLIHSITGSKGIYFDLCFWAHKLELAWPGDNYVSWIWNNSEKSNMQYDHLAVCLLKLGNAKKYSRVFRWNAQRDKGNLWNSSNEFHALETHANTALYVMQSMWKSLWELYRLMPNTFPPFNFLSICCTCIWFSFRHHDWGCG